MTHWRRPYPLTADMVLSAVALLFGLGGGAWLLYNVYLSDRPHPSPSAAFPIVFLSALLAGEWRRNRAGVFVSDEGIRIRTIFRTRTLPWASVARIDSRPTTANRFGFRVRAEAIWVLTRDNRSIETPLLRSRSELGAFIQGWRSGRKSLTEANYQQALQALRDAHRRALDLVG